MVDSSLNSFDGYSKVYFYSVLVFLSAVLLFAGAVIKNFKDKGIMLQMRDVARSSQAETVHRTNMANSNMIFSLFQAEGVVIHISIMLQNLTSC